MNKQNFSIELDLDFIKTNKKQLCDNWNDLYDGEVIENKECGLYDIPEDEENYINIDSDGVFNVRLDNKEISVFGNAQLTDEELVEIHDSIEKYFQNQLDFENSKLRIAYGDDE